jgi:Fuc2NAc and GlcNAc transferase
VSSYISILVGLLFSWAVVRCLIPHLRRGLVDEPNDRSSHSKPTPRGGGVAFVFVFVVASAFGLLLIGSRPLIFVALIAFPLSLVGLFDDRYNLPVGIRYGAQLATAILVISRSSLVVPSFAHLPFLILVLFAVTAVINFTNFMDGLDGLVAGCMSVAFAAFAILLNAPWPIWALVGALLGFLIWNWSPAKVFMGDVGSTFLGVVFAALVLQAPSWTDALAMFFVAMPLFSDAGLCVCRRLRAGQEIFRAHRLHLFQRLYQAGWSHAHVSALYIAATALLAGALLLGGLPWVLGLALLELLIGLWLDQYVAVPFGVASST